MEIIANYGNVLIIMAIVFGYSWPGALVQMMLQMLWEPP